MTHGAGSAHRPPTHDGPLLARNATLNLLGQVAPALAALVSLPVLARLHTREVLGLLTLSWVIVGYFGLFDLGLSRALTQLVAARLGAGRREPIPGLIWTASLSLAGVGAAGGLLMLASSNWIVTSALHISPLLVGDARLAVQLIAVSLPFVTVSSGLRGVLEAYQRFDLVSLVRSPSSGLMYLGPAAAAMFSRSLALAVAVLVVVRIAACGAYVLCALRVEPALRDGIRPSASGWRELAGSGAWLMVANIGSSALGYVDRLVVGAVVPAAALAYYATPQEVVTKVLIIPAAISGVVFPAFSAVPDSERDRLARLFGRSIRYSFLLLFPVTLLIAAAAPEALTLWVGRDFAAQGTVPTQWFCLGLLANGLALTPFSFVQARGGASTVASLQVLELPLFVGAMWMVTGRYGITGAAAVWALRAAADLLILAIASRLQVPELRGMGRSIAAGCVAVPLAFLIIGATSPLTGRIAAAATVLGAVAVVAIVTADRMERDWVHGVWCRVRGFGRSPR
ncbi:MAG TPA: oligosaccharide flippase family protein [Vicinamibacterales bacterium]|jgi:O-antigen/teichoic acid export membrane protein